MSEHKDAHGTITYDGIHRTSTKCEIFVHSHVDTNELGGTVECTRDVISCETSKTIKGGGGASFTLVPRRNYLNFIFPDDWVNIYFDPQDGRGPIRTFLGMVDRIFRTTTTDANGATTTRYQVVCSDFTKAFDKTQIYFNPHVAKREDLTGEGMGGEFNSINDLGTNNIGGLSMTMRGIALHGSPADIMMSMIQLAIGFGAQWKLPKSYPLVGAQLVAVRAKRAAWARERLSTEVQQQIAGKAVKEFEEEITKLAKQKAAEQTGSGATEFWESKSDEPVDGTVYNREEGEILKKMGIKPGLFQTQEFRAAKLIDSSNTGPGHLVDLLDFRFVEHRAIDGEIYAAPVMQQEGSLWSIINSWSNDFVNELFCDLRITPAGTYTTGASGKDDSELTKDYGKEPDELTVNEGAFRYGPAIVMREFPFSTIEGVALPASLPNLGGQIMYFGSIFSQEPNISGRKIVTIPSINNLARIKQEKSGGSSFAKKHLDVVAIHVSDIISENIGRGDADHVNLIDVYADFPEGSSRFLTREVQPIISASQIATHGLRVREYNTRFGRYGSDYAAKAGIDSKPTRSLLARWAMLIDHWYQHNTEYLTGTMQTRGMPEIRVGYRLDVIERGESYYVEGVNHQWVVTEQGTTLQTGLTLSRGQRNDPYPVYVLPQRKELGGIRIGDGSRLTQYFPVMDPSAVQRTTFLFGDAVRARAGAAETNIVDDPETNTTAWAKSEGKGYLAADAGISTEQQRIRRDAELAEDVESELFLEEFKKNTEVVGDMFGGTK